MNEATELNLRRKAAYADHVQMIGNTPMPSWIDLSVTDLCNRKCVFCPRVDPNVYPNQNLCMDLELANLIAYDLCELEYEGVVVLSGFGESTLHPEIVDLVACFGKKVRVELVTNGDVLTSDLVRALISAGVDYFAVSLYDGPHQMESLQKVFTGVSQDKYVFRDRWHGAEVDFGLKLTNRAGNVGAGNQPPVSFSKLCFYPAYSMMIDWNGDVLLCVQDWGKKIKFGNVRSKTIFDIWTSPPMMRWRSQLLSGGRTNSPCVKCNADGCLHGVNHAQKWDALL